MVEVQQDLFYYMNLASLRCFELPRLRFVKLDFVSKFTPQKKDNAS